MVVCSSFGSVHRDVLNDKLQHSLQMLPGGARVQEFQRVLRLEVPRLSQRKEAINQLAPQLHYSRESLVRFAQILNSPQVRKNLYAPHSFQTQAQFAQITLELIAEITLELINI